MYKEKTNLLHIFQWKGFGHYGNLDNHGTMWIENLEKRQYAGNVNHPLYESTVEQLLEMCTLCLVAGYIDVYDTSVDTVSGPLWVMEDESRVQ